MVEAASRAIWQGGTRERVRGSPPSGSNTRVPVSAMALAQWVMPA